MTEVKLEALSKRFGEIAAVDAVDLTIESGEFIVLVGPSGSGKTTCLRMIAGLEMVSAGAIYIGDRDVAKVHAKDRDVAMVFQLYALYPHMTVAENMGFALKLRKMPRDEIRRRVHEVAEILGITEELPRRPKTLSGGQQQRVALGRAIVRDPAVFLFDEPLSNLDAKLREQMRVELEEMVARIAITTLYVTHDQSEALSMSDRVAVMSDGLIVQEDAPRDVYSRPTDEFVASFLGTANFIKGQVLRLTENGLGLVQIDEGKGDLSIPLPKGMAEGEHLEVVVRPEDIHASEAPPEGEHNILEGTIDLMNFQGGYSECFVYSGGLRLRCIVHQSMKANRGDKIWLTVDPQHCVVFPGSQSRGKAES